MNRFSQAISEGDGISIVPVLAGDVGALATLAEGAGAEAVAVWTAAEAESVRARTGLPIVVRRGRPPEVRESGADAAILVFEELEDGDELERLYAAARDLDLDCAVDVRDEEELRDVLERVDPDIIVISEREPEKGEEELERTLDLLPDVPAGKLVVSESRVVAREQAVALERAGVDAILVDAGSLGAPDFASALAQLTGR